MARPLQEQRRVLTGGGTNRQERFTIDQEDMPAILGILSDKLYANPVAAVLREYSCNAWDAHVEHGVPDLPISVTLPTIFDTELVIRDYGPGLSPDGIFNVYVKYGKSTKTGTNKPIGQFGLGAKAAFAYSTSFTIISYHGGLKRTYTAYVDEDRQRTVAELSADCKARYLMKWLEVDPDTHQGGEKPDDYLSIEEVLWDEEDTDEDNEERIAGFLEWLPAQLDEHAETGMELRVPVQQNDFSRFKSEAERIFRFFEPLPEVKGQAVEISKPDFKGTWLKKAKTMLLRDWQNYDLPSQWTVVMGNVAYVVPVDQLRGALGKKAESDDEIKDLLEFVDSSGGVIYAEVGELEPNPNRESLSLGKVARRYLLSKLEQIRRGVGHQIEEMVLNEEGLSSWELRKQLRHAVKQANLSWRKVGDFDLEGTSMFGGEEDAVRPMTFNIKQLAWKNAHTATGQKSKKAALSMKRAGSLPRYYNERGRNERPPLLVIRDTDKVIRRLRDHHHDYAIYIVEPVEADYTYDEAELEKFLKWLKVDGMPVRKLSSFPVPEKQKEEDDYGNPLPAVSRTAAKKSMYSGSLFVWAGEAVRHGAGCERRRGSYGQILYITTGTIRLSDNWKLSDTGVMPENAVYVVLDRFIPDYGGSRLKRLMREQEAMLQTLFDFDEDMPLIMGIKAKAFRKKGVPDGCVRYRDWIGARIHQGLRDSKEVRSYLRVRARALADDHRVHLPELNKARITTLRELLGGNHPIVRVFTRHRKAAKELRALDKGPRGDALRAAWAAVQKDKVLNRRQLRAQAVLRKRVEDLTKPYPMMLGDRPPYRISHFGSLPKQRLTYLTDYIKLVDSIDAPPTTETPSCGHSPSS